MSSETPELVVPDVVGEIVGWRAWKVIGSRPEKLPMLASVVHGHVIWHPGYWTSADCDGHEECQHSLRRGAADSRIPGEHCHCGLYCAKDRAQLVGLGYGRHEMHNSTGFPKVVGEVGLIGKVIPGSKGWRGEKGRIVRLYVPFEHWRLVDPLEALYGVPVELDNTTKVEPTRLGEVT